MNPLIRCVSLAVALPDALTPERQRKLGYWAVGGTALILFGDTLIPLVGHMLLLCLEVLEATFDHFVESVFHVDSWTSQLITAWTGFFVFLIILAFAVRWVRRMYRDVKERFTAWCHGPMFHA